MPPSVANKVGISILQPKLPYVCPTCNFRNALVPLRKSKRPGYRVPRWLHRKASTIASVTTINAKKDIPHAFQGLYEALGVMQREAAVYANLSQIRLALRGLESEDGITRIAALGRPGRRKTRRLVKALLADPLVPQQDWEKHLLSLDDIDGRAVLLRYGEQFAIDQSHPLVRTLSLPSLTLQTHNLEILIHTTSSQSDNENTGTQGYLTPGLETQTSASGRFSTVTYPVHKALIMAHGEDALRVLLPLISGKRSGIDENMVMAVVDTPWDKLISVEEPLHPISPINLDRAEQAIATFRKSLDNSFNYEHAWFDSGLPMVSQWLIEDTETIPGILKPTIRRLIEMLAINVEHAIDQEESEHLQKQVSSVVPTITRDTLHSYIANWAEAAHTELRDQLDLAFTSKQWRTLAWWKLFWCVDDVSYILSAILRQSWLLDADRGIIYLAGRIEQAGLLPSRPTNPYDISSINARPDPESRAIGTSPPYPRLPDLIPSTAFPAPSPTTHPLSLSSTNSHPIPSISHTRQYLLATTIPPMQFLANRLLLHTLSTTFLTSSLSTLLYISISTTSIYEAGAIAAVGLVYSLRRLQTRWEEAKEKWMGLVREEGRRVLRRVEDGWRGVVRERGMGGEEDVAGREERERARRAVGKVKEALKGMER
ncbi:MAG: hypothetical protein Q9166_007829 [cf. Caloplaca sp. 2 TL-2023]